MCGKNTKVLCFPRDMVNDLKERILEIADEYPTVTNITLHTGSNDVSKQQPEVLKRDCIELKHSELAECNCIHQWTCTTCQRRIGKIQQVVGTEITAFY